MAGFFFDRLGQLLVSAGLINEGTGVAEQERTPTVFKAVKGVVVTAGTPVAIWTPAAGKRFRLMGWTFGISTASGAVYLNDGATNFAVVSCSMTSPNEPPDLRNGYLSAAVNNVLELDVASSCTVYGTVWGTEE